jgi:CheY-like chemotaxis protein
MSDESPSMPASILIVEDERRLRYFASEVFRLEGIAATTAADGCQAIAYFDEIIKNGGVMPRIVILDMTMPCMSGLEVYQNIAPAPWIGNTTVIFTSATGDTIAPLPGPAQTLTLHKPYEVDALIDLVRSVAPDLFES